jgi:membrane-associated phospholipid phosphatase
MAAHKLVHVHGMYFYDNWRDLRALHKLGYPHPAALIAAQGRVYLPGVLNIFGLIMHHWYNPSNGTIFFQGLHLSYDRVGAIPSEHAAYPLLFFLFLRRQFGRIAYLALLYIAALLFSITYMGQHYVVDALVGFAYAGLGYALVMHLAPRVRAGAPRRWGSPPSRLPSVTLDEVYEEA